MNKRIFLDIGANTGQSLAAVLDPVFGFDKIYCFEPVSSCWGKLEALALAAHTHNFMYPNGPNNIRVQVQRFGLWNKDCKAPIFQPGSLGASVWRDKGNIEPNRSEMCYFRRATRWFEENLDDCDTVFVKFNCEGAECDILDDLLDSDEFKKIDYMMIDFDVRKIPSQKHREFELRKRLSQFSDFRRVAFSKEVMRGRTHQERIKHWLRTTGAFDG